MKIGMLGGVTVSASRHKWCNISFIGSHEEKQCDFTFRGCHGCLQSPLMLWLSSRRHSKCSSMIQMTKLTEISGFYPHRSTRPWKGIRWPRLYLLMFNIYIRWSALRVFCCQFGSGTGATGTTADTTAKPTTAVPQPTTAATTTQPKEYTETNIQVR